MKNVTLKQIADMVGVSTTTVYRVINNKEGCKQELRQKILDIANEMGYSSNLVASSLRKGTLHFALIFPKHSARSEYFLQQVLNGYLQYRNEACLYNVVFQEYYCENTEDFTKILKKISVDVPVRFDGVLIYGLFLNSHNSIHLARILGKGIKCAFLESRPSHFDEECCVTVDAKTAGNIAAELIVKTADKKSKSKNVVILEQSLYTNDANAMACECALLSYNSNINVFRYPLAVYQNQTQAIKQILQNTHNVWAVYATCARHTADYLLAEELCQTGAPLVIGSELFAESYSALQNNKIDVIIDKMPFDIGYNALKLLHDNVAKNIPLPLNYFITPRIIIKANSAQHYDNLK